MSKMTQPTGGFGTCGSYAMRGQDNGTPHVNALATRPRATRTVLILAPIPVKPLAPLRATPHQYDVVLNLAGTLEEGIPGVHGRDVIRLPDLGPPYERRATLDALSAEVGRSLLLLGASEAAEPFLQA